MTSPMLQKFSVIWRKSPQQKLRTRLSTFHITSILLATITGKPQTTQSPFRFFASFVNTRNSVTIFSSYISRDVTSSRFPVRFGNPRIIFAAPPFNSSPPRKMNLTSRISKSFSFPPNTLLELTVILATKLGRKSLVILIGKKTGYVAYEPRTLPKISRQKFAQISSRIKAI